MRKTSRTTATLTLTAALALGACSGTPESTSTSENPPTTAPATTAAPATTSAALAVVGYEHTVPLGEAGITYRDGGADLEMVGPNIVAAGHGTVYFADPVANELWIMTADSTEQIDLAASDILNVTAMALGEDRLYLVEVWFAPARQRLHELTRDGDLVSSIDLPSGAHLEDGLSGLLIDDEGRPLIVLSGGAAYVDPQDGSRFDSITVGGRTLTQVGPDIEADGQMITADLIDNLGGLRVLGFGDGSLVLMREEVTSMAPVTVLASVEWYGADGFSGSAPVPLDEQLINGAPGITVTEDGRVVAMIATADGLQITELTPFPNRITASSI